MTKLRITFDKSFCDIVVTLIASNPLILYVRVLKTHLNLQESQESPRRMGAWHHSCDRVFCRPIWEDSSRFGFILRARPVPVVNGEKVSHPLATPDNLKKKKHLLVARNSWWMELQASMNGKLQRFVAFFANAYSVAESYLVTPRRSGNCQFCLCAHVT